jgi:hypothetical protein
MDPISICMALAQFAPTIAGWLGGSKAQDVAQKVVGIAQAVTNTNNPDQAVAAIQNDPAMAEKFQEAVLSRHLQLAQLAHDETMAEIQADIANTASINATMQVEAKADHWPTYSWRPFIGFCFGILAMTSGVTVAVCYLGVMFWQKPPTLLAQLPSMIGAEAGVMATMSPVLGIASWFRGKMQADPRIPTDSRG